MQLVDERTVSKMTGRAVQSLRNDRCRRLGIPYVVIGQRSIRYDLDDVEKYVNARRVKTEETTE
jgi:3-deoxy-D-manno-octulosonate 8-phosphate phosphatase KdsC-like HAD superfamily phosphatase